MEDKLRELLAAAETLLELNKPKDHTKRKEVKAQGELFIALARSDEIKSYIKQKESLPQMESLLWFNLVFAGTTLVTIHNALSDFFDGGMQVPIRIIIDHACWQNADFAFEGAIKLVKVYKEYDIDG